LWLRPPVALGSRLLHDARGGSRPKTGSSRGYYCRALTGESNYNICINCDLTVSCNCQDFDGSGLIGSLKGQTLAEVFAGPVVRRFLETLGRGELPTSTCSRCPELAVIPEGSPAEPLAGKVPKLGIMIENTAHCNLRCHLCDRQLLLGLRDAKFLSLAHLERVAPMLASAQIESVYYFNLGEPFLSPTILDEIKTLRAHLPHTRIITSTNGALLTREDAMQAALLMDRVYFSIAGVDQDTLQRYQKRGDFEAAYKSMRELVRRRAEEGRRIGGVRLPIVEWKYVMFNWNDSRRHIEEAIRLAKAAGVDRLLFAPGHAPTREMSLRYFSDRLLNLQGELTDEGIAFDFNPVPDELRA